jgi:RHS repeat-associated protein
VSAVAHDGNVLYGAAYDVDGQLLKGTFGDVAKTTIVPSYDPRRFVNNITVSSTNFTPTSPQGSTYTAILANDGIIRDQVGNPTLIVDGRDPAAWPDGAKPASRAIGYDGLYRVQSVTYSPQDKQVSPFDAEIAAKDPTPVTLAAGQAPATRLRSQSFSYDAIGNTKTTDDDLHSVFDRSLGTITNGTPTQGPNRLYSASDSFWVGTRNVNDGSVSVTYDDAGNVASVMVSKPGPASCGPSRMCVTEFIYEWDELGRLAHARRFDLGSSSATVDETFAYDVGGQRTLKTSVVQGGAAKYNVFVFPSLELRGTSFEANFNDYDDTVTTEAVYLAGVARVAYSADNLPTSSGGKIHTYLEIGDMLGSTSIVLDRDTSELVERVTYGAYGTIDSDYRPVRWESFREPDHFGGKEDDYELSLSYFGTRYYSPQLGRWLSPDPLAIHDLGADLNPYAYVSGSTFSLTDPSGLEEQGGSFPADPVQIGSGGGGGGGQKPKGGGGGGGCSSTPRGCAPPIDVAPAQPPVPPPPPVAAPEPAPTPSGWDKFVQGTKGFTVGFAQGSVPGMMLTEAAKLQRGDYSNLTPGFLHWQAAGQVVGGAVGMLTGGVETVGGAFACATGFGCIPGAAAVGFGVATAVNGFAAVWASGDTERAAQRATSSTETGTPPSQQQNNGRGGTPASSGGTTAAKGGGGAGSSTTPKMFGSQGTQMTSKTIWKGPGGMRIDVENPNPGQRPGQMHFQQGNAKYLYDPSSGSFAGAPRAVNDLLGTSDMQDAIAKGLRFLGEQ